MLSLSLTHKWCSIQVHVVSYITIIAIIDIIFQNIFGCTRDSLIIFSMCKFQPLLCFSSLLKSIISAVHCCNAPHTSHFEDFLPCYSLVHLSINGNYAIAICYDSHVGTDVCFMLFRGFLIGSLSHNNKKIYSLSPGFCTFVNSLCIYCCTLLNGITWWDHPNQPLKLFYYKIWWYYFFNNLMMHW